MPMKKGTKRKASNKDEATSSSKVPKHETEPEYFDEQREFEDLWKQSFLVGTEFHHLDSLYKDKWNFSNLEHAFEQGGVLHDRKVYLFGCTEANHFDHENENKVIIVPTIVAIVSPFPPSDKIGITSVQREFEEIVDMKRMKMDWVPYIPLGKRTSSVEREKSFQIFVLQCVQRKAGLKNMTMDRIKKFEYCLPYFYNPFKDDVTDERTIVDILYPVEPEPIVCAFDWEIDQLEDFTNEHTDAKQLTEEHKDAFKEFVKEKVREAKKDNREAREKRKKAREEMSQDKVAAFESMRVYKFYPIDNPHFTILKSPFVNRYYGKANQVL